MDALTIRIYASLSEEGYAYDIYTEDVVMPVLELTNVDGGLCTTTMLNALGMATSQAADLIRSHKGTECGGCNQTIEGTVFKSTFDGDTDLCCECKGREKREGDFIAER